MKFSKRYIFSPSQRLPLRTVQAFVISFNIIIPKYVKFVRRQALYFLFTTNLEYHEPFLRFARTV